LILLTGASGFIGKHLLPSLVKKFGKENVLALTSEPTNECRFLLHDHYKFGKDHFVNAGFAGSIHTIIHAGAFTPKEHSQANDMAACSSNIYNTERLLNAELPLLNKFIYLSTLDEYGMDAVISENSPVEPSSLYGYSKLYCEKMIAAWAHKENKILQTLRVGHVYGPGEEAYQKLIPAGFRKIIAGEPLQLWGNGDEQRAFIYIADIVQAIIQSLDLKESTGVINLVSANAISVRKLLDTLIRVSGKSVSIEKVQTHTSGRSLVFDNTKMKTLLLQSETPLEEGLLNEWQYMNQPLA
jgi:nucleoside-diphosphate-sugar epimerase